jgi:hypothetical protein
MNADKNHLRTSAPCAAKTMNFTDDKNEKEIGVIRGIRGCLY